MYKKHWILHFKQVNFMLYKIYILIKLFKNEGPSVWSQYEESIGVTEV